ncbi:aspartyl protease family protein [Marinifilum caeruleilacunae]|uniref:PDZ domain-containing protein n=1 Tax=Marinifilum caeruleilacunae TaxID=2499076 RepID=A0ABX1WRM0_9BACT|nr:aspartyl protease family protein [Marinifilum caeruleilacunae]NOU58721.1 PDZ domain-containing protein [Marinifilum caeruleilacunae]
MKIVITLLLGVLSVYSVNAQIAVIPFDLKDGMIFLDVKVNDKTEARTFIFDSGAVTDVIDSTIANQLHLKGDYKLEVSGASGKKAHDVILNQKIRLQNNIEIDSTHLVLANLEKLRAKIERNFDGIMGYSLLRKYITKIDYENRKLELYHKIQNVDTLDYTAIPFVFDNGIPIPQFDISFTLRNGESFTGKILFDSGASLTLFINTPYNIHHNIIGKSDKSFISTSENIYGETIFNNVAIQSLNICGYDLGEMIIPISQDKNGISSHKDYLGLLGAKVISRFHVILDYSSFTLYLKPNRKFSTPFEFPTSGIKLKMKNDCITVDQVAKISPAYQKGIRKGDQLLSVNKDLSGNIDTYRTLLKKEGQKVHLEILNSEGETKTIRIKLERLL